MTTRSAGVFIDKDGTLLQNVAHNVDPARVRFTRGATAGLRLVSAQRYPIVIVTNQPGVALGLFDQSKLRTLQKHLQHRLARYGIPLAGFFACPHSPECGCDCRKPASGLLVQAAKQLGLDLKRSWMIGDILDDIEAGSRAGCRTILLDVGNETVWRDAPLRRPTAQVRTLRQAAYTILAKDRRGAAPAHVS